MMYTRAIGPTVAIYLCALSFSAAAAPLTVVNVSAPNVNCVFSPDCKVAVTDTIGMYPPSPGNEGPERLQSRTYVGKPGTPGAGKTAYVYRVDFTQAHVIADQNCAINLKVDFGPIAKLPYGGSPADVFVITSGGLGSVGLVSADQVGRVVTFTFKQDPLPVCPGQTSFFFGLASAAPPRAITAQSDLTYGGGTANVAARAPAIFIRRIGPLRPLEKKPQR